VFGLTEKMADAFGATVAVRLPQGGAETGGGGTAGVPGSSASAVKEAGRARTEPAG
jgi:glycine cleavage system H lipoate-binding protein